MAAVTVTPYDDGGRIDEPALAGVVERLTRGRSGCALYARR
ncbi:hypothetical protein OHB01_39615 [Microbispora hainanensis]|jgi:hypothetical protein|uniref:Dihydrodipicolinate synthase family protein n=1 Tax=Microbispora hainanensis TaxID=568844 RepID=A0ABZ1T018_9ACTN|nr:MULTISPECIES: hypothetical protein [Microbispora]